MGFLSFGIGLAIVLIATAKAYQMMSNEPSAPSAKLLHVPLCTITINHADGTSTQLLSQSAPTDITIGKYVPNDANKDVASWTQTETQTFIIARSNEA